MRCPASSTLILLAVVAGAGTGAGCGTDEGPRPATTAPPAAARAVTGFGFRTVLPASWGDVRDQLQPDESTEARADVAFGDLTAPGFKPTVVVVRQRGDAIRTTPLAALAERVRGAEAQAPGRTTSAPAREALAGELALRLTTRGSQGGRTLQTRRILVKHADTLYTTSYTSEVGDARADAALVGFLRGWRWTD